MTQRNSTQTVIAIVFALSLPLLGGCFVDTIDFECLSQEECEIGECHRGFCIEQTLRSDAASDASADGDVGGDIHWPPLRDAGSDPPSDAADAQWDPPNDAPVDVEESDLDVGIDASVDALDSDVLTVDADTDSEVSMDTTRDVDIGIDVPVDAPADVPHDIESDGSDAEDSTFDSETDAADAADIDTARDADIGTDVPVDTPGDVPHDIELDGSDADIDPDVVNDTVPDADVADTSVDTDDGPVLLTLDIIIHPADLALAEYWGAWPLRVWVSGEPGRNIPDDGLLTISVYEDDVIEIRGTSDVSFGCPHTGGGTYEAPRMMFDIEPMGPWTWDGGSGNIATYCIEDPAVPEAVRIDLPECVTSRGLVFRVPTINKWVCTAPFEATTFGGTYVGGTFASRCSVPGGCTDWVRGQLPPDSGSYFDIQWSGGESFRISR